MLSVGEPYYGKYLFKMRKCFRLREPIRAVTDGMRTVKVPAGSLVEVVNAETVDKISYEKRGRHSVMVDDGVRMTVVVLTPGGWRRPDGASYDGAWDSLLIPEPGIPVWSREMSRRACVQGWDVFACGGSDGPYWQLQKNDLDGRFKDDEAAVKFVWNTAVNSADETCLSALAFLRVRQPDHYREVCAVGTGIPAADK